MNTQEMRLNEDLATALKDFETSLINQLETLKKSLLESLDKMQSELLEELAFKAFESQ